MSGTKPSPPGRRLRHAVAVRLFPAALHDLALRLAGVIGEGIRGHPELWICTHRERTWAALKAPRQMSLRSLRRPAGLAAVELHDIYGITVEQSDACVRYHQ